MYVRTQPICTLITTILSNFYVFNAKLWLIGKYHSNVIPHEHELFELTKNFYLKKLQMEQCILVWYKHKLIEGSSEKVNIAYFKTKIMLC
jgi:hypothetical protein